MEKTTVFLAPLPGMSKKERMIQEAQFETIAQNTEYRKSTGDLKSYYQSLKSQLQGQMFIEYGPAGSIYFVEAEKQNIVNMIKTDFISIENKGLFKLFIIPGGNLGLETYNLKIYDPQSIVVACFLQTLNSTSHRLNIPLNVETV